MAFADSRRVRPSAAPGASAAAPPQAQFADERGERLRGKAEPEDGGGGDDADDADDPNEESADEVTFNLARLSTGGAANGGTAASETDSKAAPSSPVRHHHDRLVKNQHDVVVTLADQQADPNSPLYSITSFEDLGLIYEAVQDPGESFASAPAESVRYFRATRRPGAD
ncbi:MAG: hypothetical protein BJ554DRAFT_2646, partial [Olpidium bornovanus]